MKPETTLALFDWSGVDLVAFDVDGTLYRQSALRMRMARDMLAHAARARDWRHVTVLSAYREIREALGDAETEEFETALVARTSDVARVPPERVREIVAEWIEHRPLRYIRSCRYQALTELFDSLRASGKIIGVLSDYPVLAKLEALGLAADHIACAGDPHIGLLKPNPKGLLALASAAGVPPERTLLIGDRVERDGLAARRAGAHALIRSGKPIAGWRTFARFDDPVFAPVLKR